MFWQLTDSSISCMYKYGAYRKRNIRGGKDGTMLVLRFPQCIVSSTNLCSNPGPKPLCSVLGGASLLLLLHCIHDIYTSFMACIDEAIREREH